MRRALDEGRRLAEMVRRKAEEGRATAERTRRSDADHFQEGVRDAIREQAEISAEMRTSAETFGVEPSADDLEKRRPPKPRVPRKRR